MPAEAWVLLLVVGVGMLTLGLCGLACGRRESRRGARHRKVS